MPAGDSHAEVKAALLQIIAQHQAQEQNTSDMDYSGGKPFAKAPDCIEKCAPPFLPTPYGGERPSNMPTGVLERHPENPPVDAYSTPSSQINNQLPMNPHFPEPFCNPATGYRDSYLNAGSMLFSGDKDHRFEYSHSPTVLLGNALPPGLDSHTMPAKIPNFSYSTNVPEHPALPSMMHRPAWASPHQAPPFSQGHGGHMGAYVRGRGRGLPF